MVPMLDTIAKVIGGFSPLVFILGSVASLLGNKMCMFLKKRVERSPSAKKKHLKELETKMETLLEFLANQPSPRIESKGSSR